jgi:hypothetical protein
MMQKGMDMNAKKKPNRSKPAVDLQTDIASVEAMSDQELDATLAQYGIDPQPAIDKVRAMVQNKLHEWRARGVLHAEETVAAHPTSDHAVNGEE